MSFRAVILVGVTVLFSSFYHPVDRIPLESLETNYPFFKNNIDSLRGKLVLYEFWASWCQPCRVQNLKLEDVQTIYANKIYSRGKGLAVCGISIDTDSSRWRKAIVNDGLQWDVQILDTSGFNSPFIRMQKVTYLPMNLLVDSNGKVLGRGLYGKALENTLSDLLQ